MNLASIPDDVWLKLAQAAVQAVDEKIDVARYVGGHFYRHIYAAWSSGKVSYQPNQSGELDAGWDDLVEEWTKIKHSGASLGDALGDDSVGKARVQIDKGDTTMARLWEYYNDNGRGDRFQFVVNTGGGMVLFNRMRRGCQTYIIEKLARKTNESIVRGWKVFGEEGGEGRSDSCVVYLGVKWTDARLADMIKTYVWPHIKDLVDSEFKPLGFHSIDNKPLWAMPMPEPAREKSVLGAESRGSAGGLMKGVLGLAFRQAEPKATSKPAELVPTAKTKAEALVKALYA